MEKINGLEEIDNINEEDKQEALKKDDEGNIDEGIKAIQDHENCEDLENGN